MESVNKSGIFACGDCCHIVDNPRPKAGVFAVRAGPPLLLNIRKKFLNLPLEIWEPQVEFLGIIFTGNDHAIAARGSLAVESNYLWKLKDNIDRKWMRMYQILPDMEEMMKNAPIPTDIIPEIAYTMGENTLELLAKKTMRCGGCGSKVGAQVLSRVLKRIKVKIPTNPYVITGVGDDAALIKSYLPTVDTVQQSEQNNRLAVNPTTLVHTVDFVKSFHSDPYIFGQITALHALSDIHAMNGIAVSALAVCVVPYGPEHIVEDTLVQILAGTIVDIYICLYLYICIVKVYTVL